MASEVIRKEQFEALIQREGDKIVLRDPNVQAFWMRSGSDLNQSIEHKIVEFTFVSPQGLGFKYDDAGVTRQHQIHLSVIHRDIVVEDDRLEVWTM